MSRLRTFLLLALVLLSGPAAAQQFQCGAVTTCPTASVPFSGNELIYIVQGGISKQTTLGAIVGGTSMPLVVGSSPVLSGTSGEILYDNGGVLGQLPTTGSGSVVLAVSPALTGTPTAPTQASTINGASIATTAWVKQFFPNLTTSVESIGTPGMDTPVNFFLFNAPVLSASLNGNPTLRVDRQPTGVGGTPGGITASGLWVNTVIPAGDQFFEWGFLSQLTNGATTAGQNVAIAGYSTKVGTGLTVSPTWGVVGSCQDNTGVTNPTASCLGAEFDTGTGPTINGGTDTGHQRVGVQIVGSGASGTHISYGVDIGGNTGVVFDEAIFLGGLGTYVDALNTLSATGSGKVLNLTGFTVDWSGNLVSAGNITATGLPTSGGTTYACFNSSHQLVSQTAAC